jgi:glutamyl aminopeptidase
MDHPGCMDRVGQMFREWIKSDDRETVRPTPDLRSLIYYHGMRSVGGETEWNSMFSLFEKEQDATEKTKLQSALCAVNQPWILRKLIDLASKDEKYVRKQDYFSLMGSISGNRIGESIVWDYVRDNWSDISTRFGLNERNLGRMIPTITSRFTTVSKLNEMKRFFEEYPEAGAGANARIQALEAVENNIKWLQRNQQPIGDWLSQ